MRQYAAFRGEKLLAAIPDEASPGIWNYTFVDDPNAPIHWTPDMASADIDQSQLWQILRNHPDKSREAFGTRPD